VGKVLTNRTGSPRGLYAFDYRKGQIIWKYKTGALVHSVSVHDINQDGKNEYLLTTHCAWNLKKPINATDDGYVYFIIVDHQGNAKLIERLGGVRGARSRLFTGDIDGDQQTDYIVVYNNRERITGDDPTVIYLYQSSSNTLVRKLSLHRSFWYLELQDITGDGQADLVFVDGDGNIGRISYINSIKNFKLIEDKQLPFQFIPGTVNEFIADLNNDARNEILINAGDNLFVLDTGFNTQAIYPKLRFLSFVQSGFGKIRILAGQENMTFLLDYEKNPQYYLRKAIPNLQILSISLFAFSLLGILAIVIKNEWTKPYQEISEKGMIRVDRKNRIGFINETARDMLHLLPDSPLPQSLFEIVDEEKFPELHRILLETDRSHSQFTEHVELSVNDNRRIFQVEVEPITGIAGRIKGRWIKLTDQTLEIQAKTIMDWARVARALAHEIKNFLMPIWLDLSSIQQMYGQDVPENRDKYDLFTSAIGLQIERIRKASNAFMNFTELSHSNIRLCNINEIIEDAIEKLEIKQYYPDVVTWKLLDNPPRVRVDAERIGSALSNLINNALNAVSEKGEVTITTSLIEKIAQEEKGINTFVQIEIADTGVGMSKEEVQKVFKAGFSTKESGTGFGMTIAKYAIESHGGTIQIVSKKGSGTVVTVELPVS
ncbi:MAG: ATP-binding protein, partial [Candidatus Heimdallarchaeota archaeon]